MKLILKLTNDWDRISSQEDCVIDNFSFDEWDKNRLWGTLLVMKSKMEKSRQQFIKQSNQNTTNK